MEVIDAAVIVYDAGTVTRTQVISSPPPLPPVFVTVRLTVLCSPAAMVEGAALRVHDRAAKAMAGEARMTPTTASNTQKRRNLTPPMPVEPICAMWPSHRA